MVEPELGYFVRGPVVAAQEDVKAERARQRLEFSADADDALVPAEWIARIAKHVGRAVTMEPHEFRHEMVVVGALAHAALESFDRKMGEL